MILDYLFYKQDVCYICKREQTKSLICASCLEKFEFLEGRQEKEFGTVHYPMFYNNYTREMIKDFKFKGKTYLAKPLALILKTFIDQSKDLGEVDVITFVPMARAQEFDRGYNQAELLARELGKLTGKRVLSLCSKVKKTVEQNKISRAERGKNLKGTFEVNELDIEPGLRILVIDDLVTSGETLKEFTKTVKATYDCDLCYLVLASSQGDYH